MISVKELLSLLIEDESILTNNIIIDLKIRIAKTTKDVVILKKLFDENINNGCNYFIESAVRHNKNITRDLVIHVAKKARQISTLKEILDNCPIDLEIYKIIFQKQKRKRNLLNLFESQLHAKRSQSYDVTFTTKLRFTIHGLLLLNNKKTSLCLRNYLLALKMQLDILSAD